jgi:hypothetical protein
MPDDPTAFRLAIEPFMALWKKLRIAGVAVLRNGRWISLSTRIALSHMDPEPEFFIQPTSDFIGFSSDVPLSEFDDLLKTISTRGCFTIRAEGKSLGIFLTLAYANSESSPQPIQLGPPFSTISHQHDGRFELGDSQFRLANNNVQYQFDLINYDQLNAVSSTLRVHTPPYNGVTELLLYIGAPFDRNQNQTLLEIVAPLPFSMVCSDNTVTVSGSSTVMQELRVIGFFDTGKAAARLNNNEAEINKSCLGCMSGEIPWPEKSKSGKLFLYFANHEVGSVSVRRWAGTTNWRIQVQEFFDGRRTLLTRGLEARKEQTEFELAVVRLLNELRTSTIWYGDRQYQDGPDLAACIESKNEWIVIFGECTVQKPSVKFTPLLTRKKELEKTLKGDVQVIPAVFTSSTLSNADREQARQDGIALVGADELAMLLQGVDQEWGPDQVIEYLKGLLTAPLEIPIQWQS